MKLSLVTRTPMFKTRIVLPVVSLMVAALVPVLGPAPSSNVLAAQAPKPVAPDPSLQVPYTEAQAARGQMHFRRNCSFCHFTNPSNAKTDREPLRGGMLGAQLRSVGNLGGGRVPEVFPTVYHIFARIRDGMPAWDIGALSDSQKLDIVAFLMKENGFRAGTRELPLDVAAMKKMPLSKPKPFVLEPGFTSLFNGKDFKGLKFFFGYYCEAPPGCGKSEPESFSVRDGMIVGNGRYHGYLYTEKRYRNFDFRADVRVEPPPDYDLSDDTYINGGGFFLFVEENRIWPNAIEIEGDFDRMLHPYALTAPRGGGSLTLEATYDREAMLRANRGPGPWNSVRLVAKDGQVEIFLNGTKISHVSKHPYKDGHIGIQYQGGTWMWRNIRIKAED